MGIKGLDEWLSEKGLIKTEQISLLENHRVGVDAHNALRTLRCHEINQLATGGVPITLKRSLLADVEHYKSHRISPLWVFNGLKAQAAEKPRAIDPRAQFREKAWDLYQNGQAEEASSQFQQSLPTDKSLASFFAPQALRYLQEANEQTFVAPMQTWPQLAHWLEPETVHPHIPSRPVIHAIYGPTELLLYGVRFLILSFDWHAGTFQYVEYGSILKAAALPSERFFEACVLAGFEGIPHILLNQVGQNGNTGAIEVPFASYLEARANGAVDVATLLGGAESPKSALYARNAALVRSYLILDLFLNTRPFQRDFMANLALLRRVPGFDVMMPESIYGLISAGAISPQVPNVFLSGVMVETTPLVDSPSYRKLLDDLLQMRSRTLALFAHALPASVRSKNIVTWRWFDAENQVTMPHAQFASFSRSAGLRCFVTSEEIEGELKRRDLLPHAPTPTNPYIQHLSLPFILATLDANKAAAAPPAPSQANPTMVHELQASILALTLEIYQYVAYGRSLNDIGLALKEVAPAFAPEAFIFLELLRYRHIHGEPLHPSTPVAENDPELMLITRIFSMVPMTLTEKWLGPIDRELTAFNSLLRATYKTARNVAEMCLVSLMQAGRVIPPHDYAAISKRLPWFQESSTALGVVVSSFLLEESSAFNTRFSKLSAVKDDLKRGYAFWKNVEKTIEVLSQSTSPSVKAYLTPQLLDLFKSAGQRLNTAFAPLA